MAIGDFAKFRLAATEARWTELVGKPELKGINGNAIGALAEEYVERHPVFVPRLAEKRPASASESWFKRDNR